MLIRRENMAEVDQRLQEVKHLRSAHAQAVTSGSTDSALCTIVASSWLSYATRQELHRPTHHGVSECSAWRRRT